MINKTTIVLVTGGARSGKSRFALEKANGFEGHKVFLATAEALDEEMNRRVREHRNSRGVDWETIEEPFDLCRAIKGAQNSYQVVLLDCLTLWISNLMTRQSLEEDRIVERIEELVALLPSLECSIVVVTNEVGMGVVPENRLARLYRDLVGFANRRVGEVADEAYLLVSGLPLSLK